MPQKKCQEVIKNSKKRDDESENAYNMRIRQEFLNILFGKKHFFKGQLVKFDKNKTPEGEVVCFWHITTDSSKDSGERKPDPKRYKKSTLVFLIIDHCDQIGCPSITAKPDEKFPDRISVYCADLKYAIILKPKETHYDFVTAYPVSPGQEQYYL